MKKYCEKEEKLLLRSNFSSFPQYFQYTSKFKSPITCTSVKCGCLNYLFLNSATLLCRDTDILKYFRESRGIRENESRLYSINYYLLLLPRRFASRKLTKVCGLRECWQIRVRLVAAVLLHEAMVEERLCRNAFSNTLK